VATLASCAGTLGELELGETSAEEPSVLAAIMNGSANYVLLPTTLAGPDLWMRATIDGDDCIVALQSKVDDAVYSWQKFAKALESLDPIKMYSSTNAAAANWQRHLAHLQTMPYHRIVFNACGFTSDVQHAVREYNLHRGGGAAPGQPRRYIHLLHLDDLRPYIGELYGVIKTQLKTTIQPSEHANSLIPAREWRNMSNNKRRTILVPRLQELCKHRRIALEKKRKPQLIEALNQDSTCACVAERLNILDPHFS
jgi:hypothetical protein